MALLVAIGGRVGTGKTTLAYGIQKNVPLLKSAVIIEDDQIRRELLGFDLGYKMENKDYTGEVSARVVEEITRRTTAALHQGIAVIDPSGFSTEKSRQAVQELANTLCAEFIGILLVAPEAVMRKRIQGRLLERQSMTELSVERGHASDACEGVIDKFGAIGIPQSSKWTILDAQGSEKELLVSATAAMRHDYRERGQ